jgi:phosphoglycerate dehydrogenase-like enzyme
VAQRLWSKNLANVIFVVLRLNKEKENEKERRRSADTQMEATSGEKWGFVGVGNMGKGTLI